MDMPQLTKPAVVYHADWGSKNAKRWCARAGDAFNTHLDCRGILSMMPSANTDHELSQWLRRASESGSTSMFVRKVAEAALMACSSDYVLMRPVLLELKRRYSVDGVR